MKHPPRYFIITAIATLLEFGVVFVLSSTAYSTRSVSIVIKHMASVVLGVGLMYAAFRLDYRTLRKFALPGGVFALILLILVLIVGDDLNGAKRWFNLGIVSFQPSEFAKIAVIIFFADFFCRKQQKVKEFFHGFMPAVVISSIVLIFIMLEPDLGTTILLGSVIFCMLLIAGFRLIHIFPSMLVVSLMAIPFLLKFSHVWKRLGTFFSGNADYQVTQGIISIGSGGITGSGLGQGMQKLLYVPLVSSDFAFTVIGEETGIIGCILVLLCFAIFSYFGFQVARNAKDMFGKLLAAGITLLITGQALINLGVVTGLLPNKGIPLPFISVGGSAMFLLLGGVGILLSVCRVTGELTEPEVVGGKLLGGRLA